MKETEKTSISYNVTPLSYNLSKEKSPQFQQSTEISMTEIEGSKDELTPGSHPKRGKWSNKWEFVLSCIGISVGIGNVWRFPYLAYENGGGAFLIPYLIMLVLAGKPLYFMELAFGQFAGVGPLHMWKCAPIAKGIGLAMLTVSTFVCIYYNVIMSYTLFYMFASFQSQVPWMTCGEWSDERCFERDFSNNSLINGSIINGPNNSLSNETIFNEVNGTFLSNLNDSISVKSVSNIIAQSASQQYWERYVLDLKVDIWNIGNPKWQLVLCLLTSWAAVCICLVKGVKSVGKVVYFTSTFPYLVLFILLFHGITLDGAAEGILYFIKPQWSKLLHINVWQAAASQMFFSLSIGFGGLIIFGSYNEFTNTVHRDAMIVSIMDTLTSMIAGIVIFSILGNLSTTLKLPIEDVVKSGPGLAFVVYPEALSRLPVPQLWAVLFFFMLFLLGLDSEFALLETILTSLYDEFPFLRKKKIYVAIGVSIVFFFLGLPCVTQGGSLVLNLMDKYGGDFPVLFLGLAECIGLMWIYGVNRFCDDVYLMLGFKPNIYWKSTWAVISPITLLFIFVYSMITFKSLAYEDYDYPTWADAIGWMMAIAAMAQIPFWAIIMTLRQKGPTLADKFRQACTPSADWGPNDPEGKRIMQEFNNKSLAAIDNVYDNKGYTISMNELNCNQQSK